MFNTEMEQNKIAFLSLMLTEEHYLSVNEKNDKWPVRDENSFCRVCK